MKFTKILAGVLLLLAIGLALLAWMLSREAPRDVQLDPGLNTSAAPIEIVQELPSSYSVMGAKQSVAAGQRLTVADISALDASEKVAGSFSRLDDLVGKTTLVAFEPGQIFLEQYLVHGLSLQLEAGQRAVSIAVKEPMAVGHHLRPGDFVDVFFSLDEQRGGLKSEAQARLLLARARVLAYGSNTVESPPFTERQRQGLEGKEGDVRAGREDVRARGEIPNTAVLAVPLEDVQRLALAEKYGQLSLALRHPDDMGMPDLSLFAALPAALRPIWSGLASVNELTPVDRAFAGLKLTDLVDGGAQPKSTAVPISRRVLKNEISAPVQTVEMLNGSNVQTVSY